ncbi:MAG: hypothetical protein V6Z82_02560 [Flavobacteriales bacterium]
MTYEEIKSRMLVGDYELAARMLQKSRDSVKVRLIRRKDDVLKALEAIIKNRERLIKEYQSKNQ